MAAKKKKKTVKKRKKAVATKKKATAKKAATHIVKRRGHIEHYDEKKVYASVYAAALNCHYSEQESEKVAEYVMKKVNAWIAKQKSFESTDIRDQILKNIKDNHVVLMYKHHLDLC